MVQIDSLQHNCLRLSNAIQIGFLHEIDRVRRAGPQYDDSFQNCDDEFRVQRSLQKCGQTWLLSHLIQLLVVITLVSSARDDHHDIVHLHAKELISKFGERKEESEESHHQIEGFISEFGATQIFQILGRIPDRRLCQIADRPAVKGQNYDYLSVARHNCTPQVWLHFRVRYAEVGKNWNEYCEEDVKVDDVWVEYVLQDLLKVLLWRRPLLANHWEE